LTAIHLAVGLILFLSSATGSQVVLRRFEVMVVIGGRHVRQQRFKKEIEEKTTQAVKTTFHINQGKGATLVPSTVKLLHCDKERKINGDQELV